MRSRLTTKLSDGLGGGGAHGALTNSRDAKPDGGEAVRCSALVRRQALSMHIIPSWLMANPSLPGNTETNPSKTRDGP